MVVRIYRVALGVSTYHALSAFLQLLDPVVTLGAQRLERSLPEELQIASMRGAVVAYRGLYC